MLTHLVKSVNWVDVALVLFFIRMIFIGVKNGFISEISEFFGVIVAVFVSLHFYSSSAAWLLKNSHFHWDYWDMASFAGLWFLVALFFKFYIQGILFLFKVETNHQGFDKYAAGVVAVARGILVCSLTVFLILLMHIGPLTRMTVHSYSYKVVGHAAVGTYTFLYNHLIDKLFAGAHYNAAAARVLHPAG